MTGIAGVVEDGLAIAALGFASCPAFARGDRGGAGMTGMRLPRCCAKSAWAKRTDTDVYGQNKLRARPALPGFAMTGDEIAALGE